MALVAITESPKIVACGGPITKDVYKTHATQIWEKGTLLKLASGLLTPCLDTSGGAATLDTDDTGTAGARLFLALEHHLTAGTVFHAVQEITDETILELQVCESNSVTAGEAQAADAAKGTSYALYQLTGASQTIDGTTYNLDGRAVVGVDIYNTTKPVVNVIDTENNYKPHQASSLADYSRVKVSILSAILA